MPEPLVFKIGFVLDDSLDTADGVQQYILTLGTWLANQGHEVHYLVGETTRTDISHVHSLSRNMKVRFNRNRMSMPLPASKSRLRKLLAVEQFDILHVQLPYSPFLAGRIIAAVPPKTAVVGTFHIAPHSRLVHLANSVLHLMTRQTLRRFDSILSVSSVAQTFARDTFHIESSVLSNTVELEPYLTARSLPAYDDVPTIVFLGRLVERKGCQHLLRAITRVQLDHLVSSNYRVVICGKGPLEPELKAYVATNHLQHIVSFVGFISEADKARYLASSDIAIFPSTGGESFGIVLLEAMAASRGAVLAGNNPGYASVMRHFPESLFDPSDETALARLIANFLNNPDRRQKLSVRQHREVKQYDVARVGARLLAEYTAALHKRAR